MTIYIDNNEALSGVLLIQLCLLYNSIRKRSKLSREAIVSPSISPWHQLLNFGSNSSFLEITGFSRQAFMQLENCMLPHFNARQRGIGGRPSMLDFRGRLGLYLVYAGSTCQHKFLCLIFGIIPTTSIVM